MIITEDTIIGDILEFDPKLEAALFDAGLHCAGCPSARSETLAEACEVHGLDLKKLIKQLNKIRGLH